MQHVLAYGRGLEAMEALQASLASTYVEEIAGSLCSWCLREMNKLGQPHQWWVELADTGEMFVFYLVSHGGICERHAAELLARARGEVA